MGRPIKKIYFGPATPGGSQLACEAWIDGDTQARSGYIINQSSSTSYWVQTSYGKGLCWLSDTVDQAGKMRIQVVAEGFSGISYARKITDGDMYTWDDKYFPQWSPINGQMVYGTVTAGSSWIASYGDFENDNNYTAGNGVAYDSDGNIIVVGSYGLDYQPVIMKMSPAGEIIWQKTCTEFSEGEAVITDSDNNIYAVLESDTDGNGGCIKLSPNGELIWVRKIFSFNTPSDIALRSDRSVALANRDGWIAWLNPDGTVKFVLDFDTTDSYADFASVEFVGDNLAVATPYVNYNGNYEEGVHLMLLDPTGAKIWETAYRCPEDNVRDWATYMDVDASNNIYVQTRWGRYDAEFDVHIYTGWCAKFNSSGQIQWQIDIVDYDGDFEPFTMRVTPDGTSYICGSDDEGGLSFAKINTDGTLAWGKKLLTQSYMDVSWSQGNRDIDIFGSQFIMTGYQGLVDKSQDYMFVISLPTDGTGDGTYGIYTYQNADMQALTAAWASAEISYPFVDPEVGNEVPEIEISNLNYNLELTSIS